MKKLLSCVLTTLLLTGLFSLPVLAASPTVPVRSATSFTLTASRDADKTYTQAVTGSSDNQLAALDALLGAAGKAVSVPSGAVELCRLSVQTQDGKTSAYSLLESKGNYFLNQDGACRGVTYSRFEIFAKQVGFYHYYALPTALISADSGVTPLPVDTHQYSYRSLSGTYYRRTEIADTQSPRVPLSNSMPTARFSLSPDKIVYTVYKDSSTEVFRGSAQQLAAFKPQTDTVYLVRITATYEDNGAYRGSVTYHYEVGGAAASDPGVTAGSGGVSITADASETYPGELIVLKVSGAPQGVQVKASSSVQFVPKFFTRSDGTQVALLPVSVYVATGKHWVDVNVGGRVTRLDFNSKEKKFDVQNLTVAASTSEQTILSQKANNEYENAISPLRAVADDTQYWNGKFLMPVSDNKVTTSFGLLRYTNGSTTPSRHNALDLAVPRGTSVAATGNGRVLYSGFLQLTGNTIVIEHGYGLKSWYYHMDSRKVATGDTVTQGNSIGTVGSTGFSTGPHLHFSMSVGGVFVNPYTLIQTELLAD